jgi:hypothetical protein
MRRAKLELIKTTATCWSNLTLKHFHPQLQTLRRSNARRLFILGRLSFDSCDKFQFSSENSTALLVAADGKRLFSHFSISTPAEAKS